MGGDISYKTFNDVIHALMPYYRHRPASQFSEGICSFIPGDDDSETKGRTWSKGKFVYLYRIGSLPPPWPPGAVPTRIWGIIASTVDEMSTEDFAFTFFTTTINHITTSFTHLANATSQSSSATGDYSDDNRTRSFEWFMLPSPKDQAGPQGWMQRSEALKTTFRWVNTFYGDGDDLRIRLFEQRQSEDTSPISLVLFMPEGDPMVNLVDWVEWTSYLTDMSTIAYAIRHAFYTSITRFRC